MLRCEIVNFHICWRRVMLRLCVRLVLLDRGCMCPLGLNFPLSWRQRFYRVFLTLRMWPVYGCRFVSLDLDA